MKYLGLIILLSAIGAQAGWTSGGGELVKDTHNPWFIQNTSRVQYCIKMDEANFGQRLAQVRPRIQKALKYWHEQLGDFNDLAQNSQVQLGTQSFTEVASCASADLVFQFGVLSGEQMKEIGDPTRYVGLAIRTEYDNVNLRGKGFIYISPQSGPLRMGDLKGEAIWSHSGGALLLPVLMHELGHVFGIQHDAGLSLMGETDLEVLVGQAAENARMWEVWEKSASPGPKLFKFNFNNDDFAPPMLCAVTEEPVVRPKFTFGKFKKFFGIPSGYECQGYRITSRQFEFSSGQGNGPTEILGTAPLVKKSTSGRPRTMARLFLPSEQRVVAPFRGENRVDLSASIHGTYTGTYVIRRTGEKREIFIETEGASISRIGGSMDGELFPDVFMADF